MYYSVVEHLPDNVAAHVIDLLDPIPSENPYEKLKNAVITRINKLNEDVLSNQLSCLKLGDKMPSQLLQDIRVLVGENKINDSNLIQMWTKYLPAEAKEVLASQSPDTPLEKLAELADLVHKCLYDKTATEIKSMGTVASVI
uniref:FH2 domain-containing protein n=1 Tax=Mesocestoides corti TaxID=53468 RepID=A0A5K3FQK3_MESCO